MADERVRQLLVYGAGGFGREIVWLAECCGDCKVVGVVDDDPDWQGRLMNDIPVMGFEQARVNFPDCAVVVAVGAPSVREKVTEKVKGCGVKIADLIHPGTQMSRWIDMDEGVVICAGCILTTNIQLKKHVQINLDCTIGHDVVMDDYTTLAPGVHVSGWVHFGKRVYVGTGAVFINGTEEKPLIVGDDAVIGAGAVVTRSVPPCQTWAGVPAKPIGR